jgi:LmbE family N-acetylglucosaminyl deacetylase
MNILAIGAHPDDVEAYCGGTLARCALRGDRIFIATATNGNIGSATLGPVEIARIRKEEARTSAEIIGAEYLCLDYDDEMFFESRSVRLAFIDLVRYCMADVIFTHNPQDYNPDHELTSKIVNDIAVMIPVPGIWTKNPPHDRIPAIFYWETVNGMGFIPTDYVDITDTYETKVKMFASHASQNLWMKDNYKDAFKEGEADFFESILIQSRYRGLQSGVRYAEGFIRSNDAFRAGVTRLLP